MKSTRYHYAVRWPCGIASHANTGRPFRSVHRFASAAHRDEWLALGGDFRTGSNYREAVTRSQVESEIRRTLSNDGWWSHGGCSGDELM